jgi:hypothetical protein
MTDPLNALRRSSGKSSSGLKPERAAPSVHSAARRRVGSVAVNVARDANGAVPQQVSHGLDVHAAFQPATATECRSVCTATPPTPAVSAATSTTRSRFRVTSPLKKGLTPSSPSPCTRGCGLGGRFGPAWTTDANTAGTFARLAGPPAVVYVHRAEPDELLLYAHVGPEGA